MSPIKIKQDRNIYKCISCGLVDETVECGGIYYCPNPFCTVSGATNWKIKNLEVEEFGDGIVLKSTNGWLEKGLKVINDMPYALGAKIMALPKTKKTIKDLKQ